MPNISSLTMPDGIVYAIKDSQARKDIEKLKNHGGGDVANAVLYTSQILTDAQKEQARSNIDAISKSDLSYVTPEDFGAVGDGLTDDTVAVRLAMQELCVFLKGIYKVTSPISALSNAVCGNGKAKILSSGGDCLTFANSVYLSDFAIETPYQTDGIAIRAQKDIVAERLNITGGRIGILSEGSYFKNIFRSNTFKDFWGETAAAVHVLYAGISEFSNNYVANVSNDLDRDGDGVRFWQSGNTARPALLIYGNEFYNCKGRFIKSDCNSTEVFANYLHNDDSFTVITNFVGIDIQTGNSVVRNNYVASPHAVNFSVRENSDTKHLCEENIFVDVDCPGAAASLRQVYVSDSSNGTGKTSVVIRHNKINNSIQGIQLPFLGSSVYKIIDNEFTGRDYLTINTVGTFNANTRFEIYGNVNAAYAYDIAFSGGMPNVKGDARVRCTDPIVFSEILKNTSFVANTSEVTGFISNSFMETVNSTDSYAVQLSDNNAVGAYKLNGQQIYYHAQGDPVLPNITTADNGKMLGVLNGVWTARKKGYVTPEDFGAVGDGVTNDTVAIQAAVDSGENVVFSYGKTYKSGTINVTKNIEIDCRWSQFVCTGETLFNCTGTVDSSVAGADYVANTPYALLNDDKYTGYALLRSTDNVITMRNYYYGGFVTLFAEGVCNDCRPVGFTGVTVDKITPIICKISNVGNVVFDAVRDKNTVVKCTYGLNCEFSGFDVDGDYYSIVSLNKSYRCKVSNVNGYLTYTGSLPDYYAINIGDSSECIVENCNLTSDWWHCYDVGANYLCFDNVARNCSFFADSGAVAYNNHANGIGSIIENCVINNVTIGAGGIVRNSKIVEHKIRKDGTEIQCRINMNPTNVQGINTLTVDNVVFDYSNADSTDDRGVYVRCSAYTTGNHFILDGLNVSHMSTAHDADLAAYPAVRIIPSVTFGDFTLAGDIVLDDVVGYFFFHGTNDYPNILFSGDRKALIRNMSRVRADGQGLFRLGTSSDHRFPPIVEVRDSVVWQINGQFTKLLMFNVSSTHYVVGVSKAATLIADNVSRLNTNASLLTNLTNARVTNMRYSDTSLWTYLYINNGAGNYGLLGANGIENKVIENV